MIDKGILSCFSLWELYPKDNFFSFWVIFDIMIGYVNLFKGYTTKEVKSFAVEYVPSEDLQLFESGIEEHL